ncbi:hypothetical protein, partial [Eubacterium ramulus]|uniref:hypothetical protein n=1 Tax=Eubacterium ramulus TaxID=39490 RepID=UPI00241F3749
QIPPHDGHPCLRLYPSHYQADSGLAPVRNVRRRAHTKIKFQTYYLKLYYKSSIIALLHTTEIYHRTVNMDIRFFI